MTAYKEKTDKIYELVANQFGIECDDAISNTEYEITFYEDDVDEMYSVRNYYGFMISFDDESLTSGSLYAYEAEYIQSGFSYSYGSIDGFQEEAFLEPKSDTEKEFKFSSFEELLDLIEQELP